MDHIFASLTEDELWLADGGAPRLIERRTGGGIARTEAGNDATLIEASDQLPPEVAGSFERQLPDLRDELHATVAELIDEFPLARVRGSLSARAVWRGPTHADAHDMRIEVAITTSLPYAGRRVSSVSNIRDALFDAASLARLTGEAAEEATFDAAALPSVWRDGSGAVLLHEAVGHAAEYALSPVAWPGWLAVDDDPQLSPFGALHVDDRGEPARRTSLLHEAPAAWRRSTFRDLPRQRMTALVVTQRDAPFAMPHGARIEIWRTGRGALDPLTGAVTIEVVIADLVDSMGRRRVAPFVYAASRVDVARSLAGASGEALRYSGVVCSAEGQELPVGSFAPLLLTREVRA